MRLVSLVCFLWRTRVETGFSGLFFCGGLELKLVSLVCFLWRTRVETGFSGLFFSPGHRRQHCYRCYSGGYNKCGHDRYRHKSGM